MCAVELLAKCRPSLSSKANQVLFIQYNPITDALSSLPSSEVHWTQVLFIKRSYQRRSTPAPCWPGQHMKKLTYEGETRSTQHNAAATFLLIV